MQMEKRTAEMTTNAEEQIQNYELKCQEMDDEQLALQKKLDNVEAERSNVQLQIQALQRDCADAEARYQQVQRQVGQVEGVLHRAGGLQQGHPRLPISSPRAAGNGVTGVSASFCNFEGARRFGALGPGPRNPQEASVGHFFHPHVAPYGTTAAPGCPPPGPTTGRDGSPKRSMRSFGPLFNSGYLGSARMSRRRIT